MPLIINRKDKNGNDRQIFRIFREEEITKMLIEWPEKLNDGKIIDHIFDKMSHLPKKEKIRIKL